MPAKKRSRAKRPASRTCVLRHRDGTRWARGRMAGKVMTGFWTWYRKDGSLMRTGAFNDGVQSGDWTTYAADGRVVKVTKFGPRKIEARAKSAGRENKA